MYAEAVRVFMRSFPKVVVPKRENEVLLSELRPGMVLARGVYNASGMLLMPDGQKLTETARCLDAGSEGRTNGESLRQPMQRHRLYNQIGFRVVGTCGRKS